jgi:N-acetylmuramic acid 6-phosphate etherase
MSTENIHASTDNIDICSIEEIIDLINSEDFNVVKSVQKAKPDIRGAVEDAVSTIKSGGRLIYIGAGTSGRLGVLDASEIYPTFGVSDRVKAIIAGGEHAVRSAVEGAEDSALEGAKSVEDVKENDMLLGITASGKTPFVIAALREGKQRSARCWLLTCNDIKYEFLDGVINVITGPEIIAGSTRLKAGTATKMVLNMISTITMIRAGHVYRGRMVDVVPSSDKLISRALTIIKEVTCCSPEDAKHFLEESNNNPKTAVLMILKKINVADAKKLLHEYNGSLRQALES